MELTFKEVIENAPPIKVHDAAGNLIELKPELNDNYYTDAPYGLYFIQPYVKGLGTITQPLEYRGAVPVSPHYAIVAFWYTTRFLAKTAFIKVNDWIFLVTENGVIEITPQEFTKFI